MVDSKKVIDILGAMGKKIEAEKEYLTRLDQPIGDSDHGINMARGFIEVGKKLPSLEGQDIGAILKTIGMTLVSTVGGASGPLYGSLFMKVGVSLAGKQEMNLEDLVNSMDVAVEAVQQRGKATVEEATMLDAMVPAQIAMKQAVEAGLESKDVLDAGVKAAWAGVEHTKDLIATKGRASYVGERGLGHQDPGATSFSYLLEVIANQV